jgi:hypothetical protein
MSFYGSFVIPPTLATPSDLATWMQNTAPANAIVLLRSASTLVLEATQGSYYLVDPLTGLATDAGVLAAMNQATCIQAAAWGIIGYNPLAGGVVTTKVKTSTKIGSGAVTYSGGDAVAASQAAVSDTLVPEALKVLQQNNLLGNGPYARG